MKENDVFKAGDLVTLADGSGGLVLVMSADPEGLVRYMWLTSPHFGEYDKEYFSFCCRYMHIEDAEM